MIREQSSSRAPCVVSDRVVYRSLLQGGIDRLEEVKLCLKSGKSRGSSFQERVWQLITRLQYMQVDRRTNCALLGGDAARYKAFRQDVRERLREGPLRNALFGIFPKKVRQLSRDIRMASDQDFFGAGGLSLRDEAELVRMYVEKNYRDFFDLSKALRELEFSDERLKARMERFLSRQDPQSDVSPYDGFDVVPGTVPKRFWWRYFSIDED